jgi:hypothetical protein
VVHEQGKSNLTGIALAGYILTIDLFQNRLLPSGTCRADCTEFATFGRMSGFELEEPEAGDQTTPNEV